MMQEFLPPQRLLLKPGLSLGHARALQAMAAPLVGHLDLVGFQQRTQLCMQQPAFKAHNGTS